MARRGCHSWRGLNKPKRGICPKCGKKGMSPWKLPKVNGKLLGNYEYRDCRYCQHSERRNLK